MLDELRVFDRERCDCVLLLSAAYRRPQRVAFDRDGALRVHARELVQLFLMRMLGAAVSGTPFARAIAAR